MAKSSQKILIKSHVTLNSQGRDPNRFGTHYRENGWRYRLRCNGAPIGNRIAWGIKWTLNRWRNVTLKGQGPYPEYIWMQISRNSSEIEARHQLTTDRKWLNANQMVTWSMTSRDPFGRRSRQWFNPLSADDIYMAPACVRTELPSSFGRVRVAVVLGVWEDGHAEHDG